MKKEIELIIEEELGKDCPSFVRDEIFENVQKLSPLDGILSILPLPITKSAKVIVRNIVKTFYPKISKINVVEIQKQSEEFLSMESRVVDNSKSQNLVKRKFAVNKESAQTYITSLTATTTTKNELTNSLGLGFDWGGGVKVSGSDEVKSAIDKSLQQEYSISETKKINLEDEIIVEVQPQTRTKIFVHWKLIWQHGIVKVLDSWNREIEIPFKICSKITFDQEVVDE